MFRMKKIAVVLAFSLVCAGSVWALDANEIANLIKSGVQDTVIINMVQTQKLDRPLSTSDVLTLNANGASPTLLEYLTRPEAISGAYVTPARAAPTVVTSTPTVVTSSPTVVETPTIVTSQPSVVVTQPQPLYYSPTYYYPYSSYSQPYYYSPYRYRSGPSYSFGFSFGGGNRHRWGGHRGGRPGHRRR